MRGRRSDNPDTATSAVRIPWALVGVVGMLAIVVVCWHIVTIPIHDPFYGLFSNLSDLRVYRAGADNVLDDRPLYANPVIWNLDFTYPPFSAVILTPFAVMGVTTAKVVWTMGIGIALLASILLGLRSLGYWLDRRTVTFALLLTIAVTALEPVRTTIWLGQINIFLMLLVMLDLVLLDAVRPNSRLVGIGVGIAAGIKLTPAFFVVYLAAIRRWRAAVTALVAFAGTMVVGFLVIPSDAWEYWTRHLGGADRVGRVDSPANQSINGFLSQMLAYFDVRRFEHPIAGGPEFAAPTWMWVPVAVVVGVLGLLAATMAYRHGQRLLSVTITGMTASLVSPFSWGHHWVWFVPLLLVAIDFALRGGRSRWRGWSRWLVPAALVACCFTWWWNWVGVHYRSSAHAMGLGLFMMPRWPEPGWYDRLAVIGYSGCYSFVALVTIGATLIAWGRWLPERWPSRSVA